ncbi:hypothetical protein DOY81_006290 [Sarcophaga bullata]|nr:hypothetical protein DOY81_006290 [Sarcophaga bullata]
MSIYNKDELEAPSWINQEYLENVLKRYENKENVKLLEFILSPASLKGDHYASIMFRCKLKYSIDGSENVKHKSVILKTVPVEDGAKRDMLQKSNLFETEINMYTKTLPKIEKILKDYGEPTKLAPEIIYCALEPHSVLIMEDLCEQGYEALRGHYLTETELKLVFKKIAKLHAVSYMLGQSDEHTVVTQYQKGFFCSTAIMEMDIMYTGIVNFMNMLEKHTEFHLYLEKIKQMQPDIMQSCKDLYNAYNLKSKDLKNIFVLNHGDFHLRNMMFQFNDKQETKDIMLVDYQISCYAPSIIDLTYSQYLLMSPEMRLRRNEFMQYYFTEFISMLKKINFHGELPRYSDLQITSLKYRHFGVFLLTTILALVRMVLVPSAEDLKDVDTTKLVEDAEMTAPAFENPEFIEEMRHLLPILLNDGYLD